MYCGFQQFLFLGCPVGWLTPGGPDPAGLPDLPGGRSMFPGCPGGWLTPGGHDPAGLPDLPGGRSMFHSSQSMPINTNNCMLKCLKILEHD